MRARANKAEVMSDSYALMYDRPDRFLSKMSTSVPPVISGPSFGGVDPIIDRIQKRKASREARERSERNRTISDERAFRRSSEEMAFRRRSPHFENPVYLHRPDLDPRPPLSNSPARSPGDSPRFNAVERRIPRPVSSHVTSPPMIGYVDRIKS